MRLRPADPASVALGLLDEMRGVSWPRVNEAVNLLVTEGAYHAAVEIERLAYRDDVAGSVADWALVQINVAEALYNLGRWDDASELLDGLDAASERAGITRGGLLLQRAWVAVHEGRNAEALALASRVRIDQFPPAYRAEISFTKGVARLGLGDFARARAEVEHGMQIALRASSERNGLFLLARVAAAAGEDASPLFERAANHRYRGQGGDGLLAWGDWLAREGRDGRPAWRLAIVRDPESESAAVAQRRVPTVVAE